jgi:hypothetical protein
MNFARLRRYKLTGSTEGMGKDFETWEAVSGAFGVKR